MGNHEREIPDDYIFAAAEVVEAARWLDETRHKYDEAWNKMEEEQC